MTAGNDVVDLSKWNGTLSVNIGDAFSGDNDKVTVMAGALQNDNLKLTSIENLEIVNSGTTASVALNSTNFKGLEAIKLIGDATALNVSALTQGVKIDATADADTIIGSNKADTINGGAGNDIINAGSGNDVLTGGNGADTFIVGSVQSLGIDQILDFSAEDKISMDGFAPGELKKFDASTFSTVNYKTLDSVLATFAAGGANVTKGGDVVIFSYDGKTYALLAKGAFTEAGSALVDITGANVASLTESNFAAYIPAPEPTPTPPAMTYSNYSDFVQAVAFGRIPAGEQVAISTLTGVEAGMLAVNKTYLDKIAAGGIGNVTGDIVVTVGETGPFDSAAFAAKLADGVGSGIVMNINGSNTAGDVIVTSFVGTINGSGGDDTIDAQAEGSTINGGDGKDVITAYAVATINGDAGDDTIYVKAGGSVDGGADNDTIDASAATGNVTIKGGSGNDTISLGAGADTVVFGADKDANGEDKITGFTAGASGDKLDVSAFLSSAASVDSQTGTGSTSGQVDTTSSKNVIVLSGSASTATNIKFTGASSTKYVVINDTDKKVYFYTAADTTPVALTSVLATDNQVATLTGVDATTLVADNFIGIAP